VDVELGKLGCVCPVHDPDHTVLLADRAVFVSEAIWIRKGIIDFSCWDTSIAVTLVESLWLHWTNSLIPLLNPNAPPTPHTRRSRNHRNGIHIPAMV
jgi:hypothetical protein